METSLDKLLAEAGLPADHNAAWTQVCQLRATDQLSLVTLRIEGLLANELGKTVAGKG